MKIIQTGCQVVRLLCSVCAFFKLVNAKCRLFNGRTGWSEIRDKASPFRAPLCTARPSSPDIVSKNTKRDGKPLLTKQLIVFALLNQIISIFIYFFLIYFTKLRTYLIYTSFLILSFHQWFLYNGLAFVKKNISLK